MRSIRTSPRNILRTPRVQFGRQQQALSAAPLTQPPPARQPSNEKNVGACSTWGTAQSPVTSGPETKTGPKEQKPKQKTMAELDEEVRLKLEGISGDGGASGVEYENGRAEGLKRGVKENMFRLI